MRGDSEGWGGVTRRRGRRRVKLLLKELRRLYKGELEERVKGEIRRGRVGKGEGERWG